MYVIRLHNCAFFARHGVLAEEKSLGQRFYIDAELTVDAPEALASDNVGDTIDYGEAFRLIERVVTGERFDLIEALAHRIGNGLLEAFPKVKVVEITVRKPSVPIPGVLDGASVTVILP
jgi:7,8-dihydroneopterin aldolase/epimerase/oxygenase